MEKVKDRFLRYVAVDTQSAEADSVPSTAKQFNLARMLRDELEKMGAGALRRAAIEGDVKTGSCMCGQIAGLVNSEGTCEEIITGICRDAFALMGRS